MYTFRTLYFNHLIILCFQCDVFVPLFLLPLIKYAHYLVLDNDSVRQPLTLLEYQFERNVHPFLRAPHGNNKHNSSLPYTRTQTSTLENIKVELSANHPRKAVDIVAEKAGGLMRGTSAKAWPRNLTQA